MNRIFHVWGWAVVTAATAARGAERPRLPAGTGTVTFPLAPPAEAIVQPASYAVLLARVTPAVVSVFPARIVAESDADDPLARFFGQNEQGAASSPGSPKNERVMGSGSGVVLTADGWIVTNSHVVHLPSGKLADATTIELHDRRRFPAAVAGVDPLTDLALLKVEATGLTPLPAGDSDAVKIGDLVFAIGNPFKVGMTATMGMVSATRRTQLAIGGSAGFESFIQTDAAINPGNSGGALVNASGHLVGINTAIYGPGSNIGIGFAIPTSIVRRVVARLAEEGAMVRGFFGLKLGEVDAAVTRTAGLPRVAGAIVEEVMRGGPADRAGLRQGDIVTAAAGQPIDTRGALRLALSFVKPGETIDVEYWREGAAKQVTLTAEAEPSATPEATFTLAALPGVSFRVAPKGGLQVAAVAAAAVRTKLEAGMEIVAINDRPVTTASEAETALRKGVNKIATRRGGAEETLAVRVE